MGIIKLRLTRTQVVEFEDDLNGDSPESVLAENLRNAEEMPEHVFDDASTTIKGEIVSPLAPAVVEPAATPPAEVLVSRSAVKEAIVEHLAKYDDHYMHCLTKCIPELVDALPPHGTSKESNDVE